MKNILFIQIRDKYYKEHEVECIKYVLPEFYGNIEFVNIFEKNFYIPKNYLQLSQTYSCVIIGGSGKINLSQIKNDKNTRKSVKILYPIVDICTKNDFPFLGMCLGHQLLSYRLGSEVSLSGKEIGLTNIFLTKEGEKDKIFSEIPTKFTAYQAHKDSVLLLPKNSVLLAGNEICKIQAIRYKKNVYGLQFHAEMNKKLYIQRHKLYAKLNPETNYSNNLKYLEKNTINSYYGIRILKNFVLNYFI